MPMNLDSVGSSGDPVERSWTSTDCILYALGVGAGSLDATGSELEFTTENSAGIDQQVLPPFASIVGAGNRASEPGSTSRKTGEATAGERNAEGGAIAPGARQVTFAFGTFDP